ARPDRGPDAALARLGDAAAYPARDAVLHRPAHRSGRGSRGYFVTHAYAYDAVLLAGFGGPEGPDDVMPFLRNVTRGRGVPDERLADVAQHYLALGGASPINEHNRQLQSALQVELDARGVAVPVLWGNRNWAPYLADTVT